MPACQEILIVFYFLYQTYLFTFIHCSCKKCVSPMARAISSVVSLIRFVACSLLLVDRSILEVLLFSCIMSSVIWRTFFKLLWRLSWRLFNCSWKGQNKGPWFNRIMKIILRIVMKIITKNELDINTKNQDTNLL